MNFLQNILKFSLPFFSLKDQIITFCSQKRLATCHSLFSIYYHCSVRWHPRYPKVNVPLPAAT